MKTLLLALIGASYGVLSSAGVFTVFVAIGLIPRFANMTHTANKACVYEEMVIFGTIFGTVLSVFSRYCQFAQMLQNHFPQHIELIQGTGVAAQVVYGVFSGMFVGCLALAIAEMLDSIPILSRRIAFRHGIGIAVLGMALGKLCGSLFYFYYRLYEVTY